MIFFKKEAHTLLKLKFLLDVLMSPKRLQSQFFDSQTKSSVVDAIVILEARKLCRIPVRRIFEVLAKISDNILIFNSKTWTRNETYQKFKKVF